MTDDYKRPKVKTMNRNIKQKHQIKNQAGKRCMTQREIYQDRNITEHTQ